MSKTSSKIKAILKKIKSLISATTIALPEPISILFNDLDPLFRDKLISLYYGEEQLGIDGQKHSIDRITKISPSQGVWLYNFCLRIKPEATLEIGMAYGYSSLFILAALSKNKTGIHIAIDPFQSTYWHGIGLKHAQISMGDNAKAFNLIEDRSDRALIDLIRSNNLFKLIFIDGNHRFDDVLVDFYLCAQLCSIGGYIVLDDLWMSSIKSVISYLRKNRPDFVEIKTNQQNIGVFQKVTNDERDWMHFRKFRVFSDSD